MLSSIGRAAIRRVGAGASRPAITDNAFRYLPQLQRVDSSKTSKYASTNLRASLCATRSYATAAKTTKAVKPKAKKAPAKTPTKKTATKKKPVKKPKKKVAAKKKVAPKKKVLTTEQKEALKEKKSVQKGKDELKMLKATSLIKEQPKNLPPTRAYGVFIKEMMTSRGTAPVTAAMSEAAKKWKSVTPSELERYNHEANENRAVSDRAMKEWIESYTPDQIRQANNARRQLRDKTKTAKHLLDDVRSPKRPISALLLFTRQRWASGDFKGLKVTEASKLIRDEWREISSDEKQAFEREAQADLHRYMQESMTVYNRDSKAKLAA